MTDAITVRDAGERDLAAMSELAGRLVRFHHDIDPRRYLLVPEVERGYERWFRTELANADALLLVAVAGDGSVAGYLYGRIEARDWNVLLDAHAVLHDILVRDEATGLGAGRALIEAFVARVRARGTPRVVLHTAVSNERAQRLFRALGFRPTMLEMMLDLEAPQG